VTLRRPGNAAATLLGAGVVLLGAGVVLLGAGVVLLDNVADYPFVEV
jgi:hypothetical protein